MKKENPYFVIENAFTEIEKDLKQQIREFILTDKIYLINIFKEALSMTISDKNKLLDLFIQSKGELTSEMYNIYTEHVENKKKLYSKLEQYGYSLENFNI
jgi:hypothetical protein